MQSVFLWLRSSVLGSFARVLWKELFEFYQKLSIPLVLLAATFLVVWTSGQLSVGQPSIGVYLYTGKAESPEVAKARAILDEFAHVKVVDEEAGSIVDPLRMDASGASLAVVHVDLPAFRVDEDEQPAASQWRVLHRFATARQEMEAAQLAGLISYSMGAREPVSALLLDPNNSAPAGFSRMSALPGEPQVLLVPRTIALILVLLPFVLATRSLSREVVFGTLPIMLALPQSGWGTMAAGKLAAVLWLVLCVLLGLVLVIEPLFGLSPKPGLTLQLAIQALAIFASASLGLLFAILARNQSHIHLSIAVYFLVLVLVSGFLFPLETASPIIQWASYGSPLTFSAQILEKWLFFGSNPSIYSRDVLILGLQAISAATLLTLTILFVRRRI